MRIARLIIVVSALALLAACAMPQQRSGMPSSSSSSQGSSGSSGQSGQQSPSQQSGSQGSSGSQGGESGASGASGGGSPGGSSGGSMGTEVGEQLPWPSGEMAGQGTGGLDDQFEESLGDFENTVAAGAAAGGDEDIDILDPMGGGAGGQGGEPLYEEGESEGEGGGMMENQAVASRAAGG
ncbi:MAG: hypothetical protein R3212_13630, partial [Xanthomonadales bacterium]|nr:hypothetical protein [Xanthomonadales bacterium]